MAAQHVATPCVTLETASLELEVLIKYHEAFSTAAEGRNELKAELFNAGRASYLRQRLAAVAPHRLTPEKEGHA